MAQQRQSGAERLPTRSANNHNPIHSKPAARNRRAVKPFLPRRLSLLFSLALLGALLAASLLLVFLSPHSEIGRRLGESSASGSGLSRSAWPKTLRFGRGSHSGGRDSRYWDRDDRRRDQEYTEEEVDAGRRGFQSERRDARDGRVSAEMKNGALYNEGGRAELDSYQQQYEASLKDGEGTMLDGMGVSHGGGIDEYDNEMDADDNHGDEEVLTPPAQNGINGAGEKGNDGGAQKGFTMVPREVGRAGKVSGSEKKPALKRKPKRTSCEMKFLNSTAQLVEPLENKKFTRFILQYTDVEEMPSGSENWEPRFAGHQSLQEREKSFYAHDQRINCGFVKGPNGSPSTGFDMREDDVSYMGSCHIAVASCIFGNSDNLRIPVSKLITRQSRKHVCFIMFVDEITLQTLLLEGQKMDAAGFIGLWKIVVVKNLPYPDMRRVGKIPKFLAHRLFPSARYSIWLDSKLRLQRDPLLILENVLWRRGSEYAISNHYDRHCVWEEVMQNKKLNKFNHTIIDQQFEFYQADGLKRFNLSDPNRLLPSYVPEGSFIARAHTPMSNLFSCLWFNEVDRFTPRDQLSFAYTYLKLRRMNPDKPFYLNMFKDCERRFIAKLFRHRGEDKRNIPTKQIS